MEKILNDGSKKCCKRVNLTAKYIGVYSSVICGKNASYKDGNNFYCTNHSCMERYVIRVGETGKILARFDTENQLRKAFAESDLKGIRGQRLTKSKRRDIEGLIK